MRRFALLSFVVLAAPLAVAAQQPTASQPAAPPPAVPHDSVRGAIRAIDVRARTIEVTTGVGYALRVVGMQVPASVPITAAGAGQRQPIGLAALKLGDVVRASFGGYRSPFVAYAIERIGRVETGVEPTP
ncbi:MAG: hypothetical protein E6J90_37055 [Deltaproteobacteria bacterium]|nr:MAG: hypothetical protein E6J90_37055 [Deltaproteobacteria bacterium]